jgi:hypothetical protein
MRASLVFLIAVTSAVSMTAAEFEVPPLRGKWCSVQSVNFTLYTDGTHGDAVRDVRGLETLRGAVLSLVPPSDAPALHNEVFAFARRAEIQPYLDTLFDMEESDATGAFISHRDGGIAFVDRTARDRRSDEHELVHAILSPAGPLPLWLHEGLAEYFSHYRSLQRSLVFGVFIRGRAASLRGRRLLPIGELMAITAESELYRAKGDRGLFYGESWALVHHLMAEHDSMPKMRRFVRALLDGQNTADALDASFGLSLEELERGIRSYGAVVPPRPHSVTVEASPSEAPPPQPLSRVALLSALGDAILRARPLNAQVARLHFEQALQEERDQPRALAALALLDWSKDPAKGEKQMARAEALASDDRLIALRFAQFLLTRATGSMPTVRVATRQVDDLRRARTKYSRALELKPDDIVARGGFGMTFLAEEKDFAPGLEALRQAHAALPNRSDFAGALLALEFRNGSADTLFAELEGSHDPQMQLVARAVKVDVLVTKANELARAYDYEAAAKIVRDLAAATNDSDARRQFERQAEELERVAAANREVSRYNEAVQHFNSGDRDAALQILREIIATAKDGDVIEDAKRLQAKIDR